MQDAGFNWYKQKGYIMPRREVSARLQVLQVKGYKNEGYRSQEKSFFFSSFSGHQEIENNFVIMKK